jgi:hypothetical protein
MSGERRGFTPRSIEVSSFGGCSEGVIPPLAGTIIVVPSFLRDQYPANGNSGLLKQPAIKFYRTRTAFFLACRLTGFLPGASGLPTRGELFFADWTSSSIRDFETDKTPPETPDVSHG